MLLCPGQGAQCVGMGKDLADRFPEACEVFEMVDEALGASLSTLMWEGPEEELTLTHNAQPAILAHTLATYAVVRHVLDPVVAAVTRWVSIVHIPPPAHFGSSMLHVSFGAGVR